MPVFELSRAAGRALRKVLTVCGLVGSLCGLAQAQTPMVFAAPDNNPGPYKQLSHLLPHEVRIVIDPDSATLPGIGDLSETRNAIAHATLAEWEIITPDETSEIAACGAGVQKKASIGESATSALFEIFTLRPRNGLGQSDCALMYETRFEALAYRLDAFPLSPPETGLAVFDTASFPGLRAVVWPPHALLEWAILARGVPEMQVYDILSSKRGMRLAREALFEIAPNIVWVQNDAEAARLLATGEVSMAVASTSELASVPGNVAVVLQTGQIGLHRSRVEVPEGRAMSDMPVGSVVTGLGDDVAAHVPAIWRDASWYARASAHVGRGLAGLGPEKRAKVGDTLSGAP